MSPSPVTRCRFLVIGAGLAGASTAWHLRRAEAGDVILLEQEDVPGVHSSGRNAAILRERMDHRALEALARESAAALRAGNHAPYRKTGGTLIQDGRRIDAPEDGVVDVAALLHGLLAGQDVRYGVRCEGIESAGAAIRVRTTGGLYEADVVVNAGGPWAGVLGDLPLEPRKRHLFVSAPDPAVDPGAPFLWDLDHGFYLRPESGGWLLCACDETVAEPGDYVEDPSVVESLGEKLRRHMPDLADVRIARRWVGQRTFAHDGLPVVGFDPRMPRLFHVAGLGGHGVTLSIGVGRLAADLLLGRATDEAAAFAPGRILASPLVARSARRL